MRKHFLYLYGFSKEDIEKAKRRDLLEEVLREMAGEFPELTKIFVKERDLYMAHVLRCLLRDLAVKRAQKLNSGETEGKQNIPHKHCCFSFFFIPFRRLATNCNRWSGRYGSRTGNRRKLATAMRHSTIIGVKR